MLSGAELAFALLGLTSGVLIGLWVGASVEQTRTREVRRLFRERLRASRTGAAGQSSGPMTEAAEVAPPAPESTRPADDVGFGIVG